MSFSKQISSAFALSSPINNINPKNISTNKQICIPKLNITPTAELDDSGYKLEIQSENEGEVDEAYRSASRKDLYRIIARYQKQLSRQADEIKVKEIVYNQTSHQFQQALIQLQKEAEMLIKDNYLLRKSQMKLKKLETFSSSCQKQFKPKCLSNQSQIIKISYFPVQVEQNPRNHSFGQDSESSEGEGGNIIRMKEQRYAWESQNPINDQASPPLIKNRNIDDNSESAVDEQNCQLRKMISYQEAQIVSLKNELAHFVGQIQRKESQIKIVASSSCSCCIHKCQQKHKNLHSTEIQEKLRAIQFELRAQRQANGQLKRQLQGYQVQLLKMTAKNQSLWLQLQKKDLLIKDMSNQELINKSELEQRRRTRQEINQALLEQLYALDQQRSNLELQNERLNSQVQDLKLQKQALQSDIQKVILQLETSTLNNLQHQKYLSQKHRRQLNSLTDAKDQQLQEFKQQFIQIIMEYQQRIRKLEENDL